MFRPAIGVVTRVGHDHYSAFRGLDATAREKATLIEGLPANGTAILNADDPRVLAMRELTKARVITYGLASDAMVRGEEVVCAWPDPLSLSVTHEGVRIRVETQLLGEHWAHAVLAGLATGIAIGMPLHEAAAAVEGVPPVYGRMSAHPMADGVTFVQDTWKAPLYTVPASLRFIETARAHRKIVIIGTISDSPGAVSNRYRRVARQALGVADKVLFVGPWSESALKTRPIQDPERLMAFADVNALRSFLHEFLAAGDLVLLKGSAAADHLEQLVLDWEEDFACWRLNCRRLMHCSDCRLRRSPFVPASR
jgi:UDP-N-acetylmuramoyl-tripeptide--D-alanyl-D-alanine ligase